MIVLVKAGAPVFTLSMISRLLFVSLGLACNLIAQTKVYPTIGEVVRLDPRLDALIAKDANIEVIASGFDWCEGPVWVPGGDGKAGFLLFSEIPSNSVRRWSEDQDGVSIYLQPSGYTGVGKYSGEPGSNGLVLDQQGRLISCEHGDRRISLLTKDGGKRTLTDAVEGKRFNSPNDLTIKSNGDIYFTDPIYGLPKQASDPARELDHCGVYRYSIKDQKTTLLTDVLARPNGIAFSPDEKILYVAQSDPKAAIWMAFPVKADGTLEGGKIFKDVTGMGKETGMKGLPDGMKVDAKGNLWATGPGGVHVMAPDGTLLGRIDTKQSTSNCAFGGPNGNTLFITADMFVCRIQTTTTAQTNP
jgi:gluconolactonase